MEGNHIAKQEWVQYYCIIVSTHWSRCAGVTRSLGQGPRATCVSHCFGAAPIINILLFNMAVYVPLRTLQSTGDSILRSLGFPKADRQTVLDVLLYAQLRGNNQNFIKLYSGGIPRHQIAHRPELKTDAGATFTLDGKGTFGMVGSGRAGQRPLRSHTTSCLAQLAMSEATRFAIGSARRHGVSVGALHGISSTTGAIGYWAREIARAGLVGVVCSQSPELVAPHGSAQALLGTNPVAFGFPRQRPGGSPSALVIDVATSAMAFYGVVAARAAGARLPEGVAVNAAGRPTTDPAEVSPPERGALLPFGGSQGAHKGSALSLAVELLGVLAGGAATDKWAAANWGNLIIAIDPARLGTGDAGTFAARVDAVAARIESAPPIVVEGGGGRVLLPGQRGDAEEDACLRAGQAPLDPLVWEALQRAAAAADAAVAAAGPQPRL